ncbi:acyl-CoA thioester hydrolase/BAAT C-terminal domain-containing protein [Kineosporia sp. R_H_3]|uniref:acyl-CoA thioester hydrolase/BAAT C-terminal domain-containing protein n=1 Tax=Kineosporia sp. R_H_3 TaxID=1961848 RepID=UPI000B4A5777|nr:acyl-CoA thioester hydrolase/BAAT C-terminal domain-containing protein [Kineosporia sp. R_H_3]
MCASSDRPDEALARPDAGTATGVGVLVLAGSSGRVETQRVRLLAAAGAVASSVRWFGGAGQPPGICEVPLETFTAALDRLAPECDRLAVIGTSKGAEAALLLAAHDRRVAVVAAFAPTHVVWANVGAGTDGRDRPQRSSWTLRGTPLPFVPYTDDWEPDTDPPAYRGAYEASLERYPGQVERAAVGAERIRGDVLLVAGEQDAVWPGADWARRIADRRAEHGLPTTLVVEPGAGHRALLPGETRPEVSRPLAYGGSDDADRRLGERAWTELVRMLPLRP